MSNTRESRAMTNPYATMSKSRKEWADHIKNGYPSPVKYFSLREVIVDGNVYMEECTPVHLKRATPTVGAATDGN